ncbi:LPXTG cell wall anchor domain-containing protein [Streptomyces sp. NPDC090301]|uniref:LPXTG cell wall anchor domain-containing protein n=1 Tax=Streptomyces sp. NPDC090301 TaxID=3154975 RepID=UPI003416BC56
MTAAESGPLALAAPTVVGEGARPTPTALEQEDPAAGTSADDTEPVAPRGDLPAPAAAESGPPTDISTEPSARQSAPEETGSAASRPETLDSAHESATTTSSPPGEEDEPEADPYCPDAPDRGAVRTTLLGLPVEIVAGSGWKNFTFRVANTSDRLMKSIDAYVMKGVYTPIDDYQNLEYLLTLEWYDQNTGAWETADPGFGQHFDLPDVSPGSHIDIELRIKVDPKVPTGSFGSVEVTAGYHDEDGVCGITEGDDDTELTGYDFTIVAPDSGTPAPTRPETSPDKSTATSSAGPAAQPHVAEEPGSPAPSGASLAHTGSSSAAKWLLGAGGTSIALGSALALAARKRRRHHA